MIAWSDEANMDRATTIIKPQVRGEWVRITGTRVWKNTRTGETRVVPSVD